MSKTQMEAIFAMPSCCVFPINNLSVELKYLHYATKCKMKIVLLKLRVNIDIHKCTNCSAIYFELLS